MALLGVDIAKLGLWSTLPALRSHGTLPGAVLVCISSLCLVAILSLEHRHSLRSWAFTSLYLSLTLLLDIAKSRTYFSRSGLDAIAGLSTASCIGKLALLLLEEVPKRRYIKVLALKNSLSREAISGFWTRALFLWLNPTFLSGYKTLLQVESLGNLGDDFAAEHLSAKFELVWAKCKLYT